ncbi:hypothetical protein MBANPS3_004592 [Mucor bainieri]
MSDVSTLINKKSDNFMTKIKSKIPPLPQIRTTLKATIATLVSLIFVLNNNTRASIGTASTLVTLGTLLYFPVKPIGTHIKIAIQGVLSASIGAAWCLLGNYLANLARNPAIANPIQPASSAVSAVFCTVMVFVIAYVRTKYPQIYFATIFAGMIGSFALTVNASAPGFQTSITLNFFKPLLFASAISLLVNVLIWPEDSATHYFQVLDQTLQDYCSFYQETTKAFKASQLLNAEKRPSFSNLRNKLQGALIKLVDSQHDAEFIVFYSRLSQSDIRNVTQKVKEMRTPLHGIGVSLLCKSQTASDENEEKNQTAKSTPAEVELEKTTDDLIQASITALKECSLRVDTFKERPRSLKSTILWPFPRLFVSKPTSTVEYTMSSESMEPFISAFENATQKWRLENNNKQDMTQQVAYLFQFNLLGFANSVQSITSLIEKLDLTRPQKRKLWFPKMSLKRWLKPSVSNKAQLGGQINSRISVAESSLYGGSSTDDGDFKREQDSELGLTHGMPQSKFEQDNDQEEDAYVCSMNRNDRPCPRDPDVDAPVTLAEKFFSHLSKFFDWIYSMETIFAVKTAAGFIVLSIPAYLPQSVGWFTSWGGQWVANTLLMWMIPMAGMFNFTLAFGLLGTLCGGVLSIIVYEIARGNPYGLAVLTFVVMPPFHYMFFTNPAYSFFSVMTQYAYLMIITTGYHTSLAGGDQTNVIEIAAGKRMMYIVLGIVGSFLINLIPRPVTGRVELRKRIARTFYDMSVVYGIIFSDILSNHNNGSPSTTSNQIKAFRQLTVHLQRQLKDEQTYLKLSKLEPPLKGKFPFATYQTLIEKLNNMADLLEGMAYTSRYMDGSWRSRLIHVLNEEKLDYVACLLTIMRQLSATLLAKVPLPPYLISPDDLKEKLSQKLCAVIAMHPEQVQNDTYPSYCAYSVASYIFTQELNEAAACVEKLLGVENPQVWLSRHA